MVKRFRQLESEFEGLDPGLLDEVIGYDDTEDPDLPFDSTAFAGAPSSVRRPTSPLGGGALAGTLPAPTRSRFAGFGDAPDMEFSIEETESAPDMTFSLEETESAPDMSFTLDEVDEQQRAPDMAFTLEETETPFAPDVDAPRLFTSSEVFGDSSPFADDVQAEVPGASRPVLSPTETDQDEASGDPTATAAQAERPPRARTMGVDDAFDPTAETSAERAAIARGERQDRRRRIAGGVLSGLGMLMAAGGGRGSGLGAALGGIGGIVGRSANREDRARADMQTRLTAERERMTQDRQAARDDAESEREAAEFELRRALAGSQIDQNRARIRSMDAQAAAEEARRLAAAGDAAGLRDLIRGRAEVMPRGPTREGWLRRVAPGSSFDTISDIGVLTAFLAEMGDTDVRRGTSGGGGGGGSRSDVAVDPVTGEYVSVRRSAPRSPMASLMEAQGASPAEVAAAEAQYGDTPVAEVTAAPAPSTARRPRPPAAASGAAPAGPQVLGNDPVSWGNRLRADLSRTGRTPEQVQSIANDLVAQYNDPRTRRQAVAEANRYRRDANAAPEAATAEPDRAERARWNSTVAPLQTSAGELREMVRFLRANRGEIRQALLSGDVSGLALTPVQRRIRSLITAQLSETIHRLAGAAVSAQELERIQRMMQTDTASVAANPDSAIRAIDHQLGQIVRELGNRRATFTANDEQWFMQRARGGGQ